MKIAVVGIGVAGAYLMNRLGDDHDNQVVGFERMPREQHDAVCAWATCENIMFGLVRNCGLNFDEYVLHSGKNMRLDLGSLPNVGIDIPLKGMVSYDKLKLIQDMIKGCNVRFGRAPRKDELESEFDVIVDSTGFHRNYLPRIANEMWIPCVQYKVKHDNAPFDDFYLRSFPSMSGYFWYFPLGNGYAHVGAGDFMKNHNRFVDEFLKKHNCEVIKKVGRPLRISPPAECEPFSDGRKTIGVGETIGTVYPLLGEGIIPSTWCAELFVQNLNDFEAYRQAVIQKFEIYRLVFRFIKLKITGKFSVLKHSLDMLKVYRHMKRQEERYGMHVKITDMLKLSMI